MKPVRLVILNLILFAVSTGIVANPFSGFYLPDSVTEVTLRYKLVRNLIVLPVVINDSVIVNLILDTGCRNLVLFGKKFQKLLQINCNRRIQFSGLGSGGPVFGRLSLNNRVSIQQVLGEKIPIVVVPNKNVLGLYPNVHGVIGYDIFLKFEIELNPRLQTITFRPAAGAEAPRDYARLPLRLVDSRPVITSKIMIGPDHKLESDLMIDTGSCLGLLLKTTNMSGFLDNEDSKVIGLGLNGPISGLKIISERLDMGGIIVNDLPTGIIKSPWHNHASLGMEVLKDYIIVLNYCQAYACLKKLF